MNIENHAQNNRQRWPGYIYGIISLAVVFAILLALRPLAEKHQTRNPVNVVHIKGLDYAYDAPDEIVAGWTRFEFVNEGKEPHHMTIIRMEGEHTLADFVEDFESGASMMGKYTAIGGPNGVGPGGVSKASIFMKPGNYALLCFVPSPDGKLHLMKGMLKPFAVTEKSNNASQPKYDSKLTLQDYSFEHYEPLTAGMRAIKVENRSTRHLHEVVLARLPEGRNVMDVVMWMKQQQGPPPAEFLGGVSALSPMQSNIFHVNLEPGRYAWICPMVEGKEEKSHIMNGMMEEFIVRK